MQCGLLGEKLGHSYSAQIHKYLGDYEYDMLEKAPDELNALFTDNCYDGLNVTIPYKKAVIPYCQSLTPQAKRLGAVNTIVRQPDGCLLGHNSDYFGFQYTIDKLEISCAGKKALVLGTGGAGSTVCAVLKDLGAEVIPVSRSGDVNYSNLYIHSDCNLIVNATPVGMYPYNGSSLVDLSIFPSLEAVIDLIYNPDKTKLLLDAEAHGLKTANGLWMLVAQAFESAQMFLNQKLDPAIIPKIYQDLRRQMLNVVLIGMPGCGKSTNGKLLANALCKGFVDIDQEIRELAQMSIADIFRTKGEIGFRQLETQALESVCKNSGLVIATGGGCVTRPENLPLLRQNSIVIWLKRPVEQLPTKGRPLSQNADLSQMYEIRKPLYKQFSQFSVECGATPEETTQRLLQLIQKELTL